MKKFLFLLLPFLWMGVNAQQKPWDLSSMQYPQANVSITGSFTPFTMTAGSGPSSSQSFTFTATSMTSNVVWGDATNILEVSKDGSTFSATITYTPVAGNTNGTVYARIKASITTNTYSGTVAVTATGASGSVPFSATVSGAATAHYRQITIDHTKVPNTDQSSFPILVTTTLTSLKSVGNGGSVQDAQGDDITFSTDNAGSSLLNWEIESWDPTTGALVAWVKIPTLSHTTNGTIYMRYGSTSITTFQGGAQGAVYDAGFSRVWHASDAITGSGQTVKDWTSNSGNITTVGSWTSAQAVAGQVGNGLKLLSSNTTHLSFTVMNLTSDWTLEGWFNATSATIDENTYTFDSNVPSWLNEMAFGDAAGYAGIFNTSGAAIQDDNQTTSNTWHHFAFTRTGTTLSMYRDGVFVKSNTNGFSFSSLNSIGYDNGFNTQDIIVDELRISTSVRGADWIKTFYNNTSAPGTFISIGAEN